MADESWVEYRLMIVSELRRLGDKVDKLSDVVEKLDAKLDGLARDRVEDSRRLADHEARIRNLEVWMWRAAGGAVVLSVLIKFVPNPFK